MSDRLRLQNQEFERPELAIRDGRPEPMTIGRGLVTGAIAFVLTACAAAGPTPTPTTSPLAGGPTPTPSVSPSPPAAGVASAAQAAALVLESDPRYATVRPGDTNVIGQCCTYEAEDAPSGYVVTINLGWNDCPSGCINHQKTIFHVDPDGAIAIVEQSGDENPPTPSGEGGTAAVTLHLRAGPTCPVVRNPPDPACQPRSVANADVVLKGPDGAERGRATSNADGEVVLQTPPGAYYVEPQPVQGLLGTAPAAAFSVVGGETVDINLDYDTGIR